MSAPQKLLLLCDPRAFSVYQGSFRCVRSRLQGFQWEEEREPEGGRKRWGLRERKESSVASLGSYCVSWCVTLQNLFKSHCFGAVYVGWVQICSFGFCMISGYYTPLFSSCHSHHLEFPFSSALRQDLSLSLPSGICLKMALLGDHLWSNQSYLVKDSRNDFVFTFFLSVHSFIGQMHQTNSKGVDMFFCLTESLTDSKTLS